MNVLTRRPDAPAATLRADSYVPGINLLPPEYTAVPAFRALQRKLAGGVGAAVLVVGVLALWAGHEQHQAQDRLTDDQSRVTALQSQVNSYRSVSQTYQAVDDARGTLRTALSPEVRWSAFLAALSRTVPADVQVTSLSITQSNAAASGGAGTDTPASTVGQPTVADPIGAVAISGNATTTVTVASWLRKLDAQFGVDDPYLSTLVHQQSDGTNTVKFDSTGVLTGRLLSDRYTDAEAGLK